MKKALLFLALAACLMPFNLSAQNDTIGFLNGSYTGSVGLGPNYVSYDFYWGVRIAASNLTGFTTLDAVMIYDPAGSTYSYAGTYTYNIFQGTATTSSLASGSVVMSESNSWVTSTLSSPLTLNTSEDLWIVFSVAGVTYPAAGGTYSGDPNSCLFSTDCSSWTSATDQSLNYTWMIRGIVTGTHDYTQYTITATSSNNSMGAVSGGGTYNEGHLCTLTAIANDGYRFDQWTDGETRNPRSLTVTSNATYSAVFTSIGTDTLQYDNGIFRSAIGAGGDIYWAVRFEPSDLVNHPYLNSIMLFNKNVGTCTLTIAQGGTTTPGAAVSTQTITTTADSTWHTYALSSPVALDQTETLWIILHDGASDYPAPASTYAGSDHSSLVSTDGSEWMTLTSANLNYSWMLRAITPVVENMYTITVLSNNESWGTVAGGGQFVEGAHTTLIASPFYGNHFVTWDDGNTENPRNITVTGDATYTAIFEQDNQGGGDDNDDDDDEGIDNVHALPYTLTVDGEMVKLSNIANQRVTIYDATGRVVINDVCSYDQMTYHMPASGIYMVQVAGTPAQKVVIVK